MVVSVTVPEKVLVYCGRSGVIVGVGVKVSVDRVAGSTGEVWALRLQALKVTNAAARTRKEDEAINLIFDECAFINSSIEPITLDKWHQENFFGSS